MSAKKQAKTSESKIQRHRASAIPETISYIPDYPKKLYIYKNEASRFYWVRYYAEKRILRSSTKTESKREALEAAKAFYDDIQLRIATGKKLGKKSSFAYCAKDWLSQQKARVSTKSLSNETYKQYEYRLNKKFLSKISINFIHLYVRNSNTPISLVCSVTPICKYVDFHSLGRDITANLKLIRIICPI